MTPIAFIGLGAMGWHMAAHLTKLGRPVLVYNRTQTKADDHAKTFGTISATLDELGAADTIISCLPTSKEVQTIIEYLTLNPGTLWIDCTSGEPAAAKALSEQLARIQCAFLDAPVSGQTIGAQHGTLTIMVGGYHDAFERAKPILSCFGQVIEHVGHSGAGFTVKAVNNLMMATNLWAAAEGLSTLKAHEVELEPALRCINNSSGKSGASEHIVAQRILNRSFPLTFALDLLAKDADIAMRLVNQAKISTPVLSLMQQLIRGSNTQLPANSDFSALVKLLEQLNNIELS